MFLERKFMTEAERRERRLALGKLAALPDPIREVIENLDRLLSTERGVGHVLPGFGLSRSGEWSAQGLIAHSTRELQETLPRFERRLAVAEIDADVDGDGHPALYVVGHVAGAAAVVTIGIDPVRRRVFSVALAGPRPTDG